MVIEAIQLQSGVLLSIGDYLQDSHRHLLAPKGWQWLLLSAAKDADGNHDSIGGISVIISHRWVSGLSSFQSHY